MIHCHLISRDLHLFMKEERHFILLVDSSFILRLSQIFRHSLLEICAIKQVGLNLALNDINTLSNPTEKGPQPPHLHIALYSPCRVIERLKLLPNSLATIVFLNCKNSFIYACPFPGCFAFLHHILILHSYHEPTNPLLNQLCLLV